MKLFTLKRRKSDPTTIIVYLELGHTFRAVAELVIWYGVWVLFGAVLYRAYIYLAG